MKIHLFRNHTVNGLQMIPKGPEDNRTVDRQKVKVCPYGSAALWTFGTARLQAALCPEYLVPVAAPAPVAHVDPPFPGGAARLEDHLVEVGVAENGHILAAHLQSSDMDVGSLSLQML